MSATSDRVIIIAAVIGVTGTLGAAVISNWDKLTGARSAIVAPPPPPDQAQTNTPTPLPALDVPHAQPLDVAGGTLVWGEKTKLLTLAPGDSVMLKGADLFTEQMTYPVGGCAGPVSIAYTWQIRDPYPQGGDLEITAAVQGGGSQKVGMGSMGAGSMSICDEYTFKNNGLDQIKVEVRYASTAPPDTPPG
jgi:hypothetical protein